MSLTDEQAREFGAWLDREQNFGISVWIPSNETWTEAGVVHDWIWREASRRFCYGDGDRPHLLLVEEVEPDVGGWLVGANGGDRFSFQFLYPEQRAHAEQVVAQRDPDGSWSWPLRSLLGDVPGEEPTP